MSLVIDDIRLRIKENLLKNKCNGVVLGLSGTDSILTSIIMGEVCEELKIPIYLLHFGPDINSISEDTIQRRVSLSPSYMWEQRIVIPWLRNSFPFLNIKVISEGHPMSDSHRYASIMDFALNHQSTACSIDPNDYLQSDTTLWVCGTRNKTEDLLGLYSNMSNIASIQPIIGLYKTEVLNECKKLNVPDIAITKSRMMDCDCGRFNIISDNIEMIDIILQQKTITPNHSDQEIYEKLVQFIKQIKQENSFKKIIPYKVER